MATFELPEMPEPHVSPNFLVGAASPLWGYYGAAAASGVAYWWMTHWVRPVNVEALFGMAAQALPETAVALVAPAAEAAAEATEAVVEAAEAVAPELPAAPVGGEAAPISPVVEAVAPAPEPEPEPEPAPLVEAVAEPAAIPPPEPVAEAAPEAEPIRPRVRKTPANGAADQA